MLYTFHVYSAMIAECHAIPVGSRSAVTMTASSSSIASAKILSWGSEPIPARVSTVYLMDVDIEKLVQFLSQSRDLPAEMRLLPTKHTAGEKVIGLSEMGD